MGQREAESLMTAVNDFCAERYPGRGPTVDFDQLGALVDALDGAVRITEMLSRTVATDHLCPYGPDAVAWHTVGNLYLHSQRASEALVIFNALYERILEAQDEENQWVSKSTPLVRMADCYEQLHHPVHAKRYLMLTLCDEAIAKRDLVSRPLNIFT